MIKKLYASRIDGMKESIFSTMSKLNNEYKAVNLGQGFPDFDGAKWIFDAACEAMKSGKNQYAPAAGIYSLRAAIAKVYEQYYDLHVNPADEITITAGATEALYSTINALIEPGDEVILFEPVYDSHLADILVAGGTPKFVTLHAPDFSFDAKELEETVTNRTKMILLNNPHNPTGKVYSRDELGIIADCAKRNNLLVLSDEVYEFLTFDSTPHIPIASLPGMKERTITISSTGKTFGLTGWKIGYAVASPELTHAIMSIHQWTTFAVNTPGQHAMSYAFGKLEEYLPDFKALYEQKRDLMLAELAKTKFKAFKPLGSYFMMVEIPDIHGHEAQECAIDLVKRCKVTTVPPEMFYGKSNEGKRLLRLCFAKQDQTIIDGIGNMGKY